MAQHARSVDELAELCRRLGIVKLENGRPMDAMQPSSFYPILNVIARTSSYRLLLFYVD